MSLVPHHFLIELLHTYGYWALAILIALEGLGLPLPGETLLIGGALVAVHTQRIDINIVVLVAALGSFVGQLAGYAVGGTLGYRLLRRYGARIGLTAPRLAVGRLLFRRHGVKVIIGSRFVALLRQVAGLVAGATRMPWPRFLAANAVGSVLWAVAFGYGAAWLGDTLKRVAGPVAVALGVLLVIAIIGGVLFVRHQERRLTTRAVRIGRNSL